MSEQTAKLVQSIRTRLHRTIRRSTLAELSFGAVLTLGILAACWLVAVSLEASFWLGSSVRTVLFGLFLCLALGLGAYYLARPLLRLTGLLSGPSEAAVARRIGSQYPEVSDRLLNLLDLTDGRRSSTPKPLLDRAVRALAGDVEPVPFEEVATFERARRASRWAAVPIVGLLAFLLAAPTTFMDASNRLLAPATAFEEPAPFQLQITPGSAQVVKGDSLRIRVRATGSQQPDQLTLALNNLDEEHVDRVTLTPDTAGRFQHTLVNVRKPFRYRASAEPVTSTWYEVQLTERPLLQSLRVTLDYPDYTGMPARTLDPNVGDVKALPGTEVHLEAQVGGSEAERAFVRFDNGRTDTLQLDGQTATGHFTLQQNGQYQIVLENTQGTRNRSPISYELQLLADESPTISLLEPGSPAELDQSLHKSLQARMADDYGFASLRLYYRRAESKQGDTTAFQQLQLPLESPRQLSQEITYDWQLPAATGLDLHPGDVIEYYLKVWDNDAVKGYKTATTAVHRLRYPSRTEQYEQLDEKQRETEDQLDEALQESESVQKQFQQLRDELRRKREADWEDKRQLERLRNQQQEAESKVDEAARQVEQITREMERNNLVDEETLNLYKELQRVMDEVNAPEELQQAMKKLQESMENMNMKQLMEQLENTQFNEQQYQQRLERAKELFEKIQTQQKLQEAAERAEALAETQKRLAEETKKRQDEQGQQPEDKQQQDPSDQSGNENEANEPSDQRGDKNQQTGQKGEQAPQDKQNQEAKDGENDAQSNESADKGEQKAEQQSSDQSSSQEADSSRQAGQQSPQESNEQSQNEDLAQQQDEAREDMKKLEQELDKLRQKMKQMRSTPKKEMKQLQKQMQKQQLPQKMKQNSQQLRQNQMQKAQQGQQQMQKQLQQMSQQLQQMQQSMQGKQKQMNMAGLRQALSDVLTLSQQQEDLRSSVRSAASNSPQVRPYAQRQKEISEGLRTVADTLQRLASDIPQMRREVQKQAGEALREMNASVDKMTEERHIGEATGHQKASMMHLNELALLLSDLMDQMQGGSGGSGSMSMQQLQKKLQQMAGQQQQLNKQIQQMLNQMQGDRLSIGQQERLNQMAQQQQRMQRELEKLSRNRNVKGKTLGDLKKVAEQMQETVNEMQQQRVTPRTLERQRQIRTRLLDAQRSIHNQGKKKKRQGKSATDDFQRESPEEFTPEEEAQQLRRALIRALEKGYSPDYEQLIKRYFELLQQQQPEEAPESP